MLHVPNPVKATENINVMLKPQTTLYPDININLIDKHLTTAINDRVNPSIKDLKVGKIQGNCSYFSCILLEMEDILKVYAYVLTAKRLLCQLCIGICIASAVR